MSPRKIPPTRSERLVTAAASLAILAAWIWGGASASLSLATVPTDLPIGEPMFLLLSLLLVIVLNALWVASETAVDLISPLHVKHGKSERAMRRGQTVLEQKQRYGAACGLASQLARLCSVLLGLLIAYDVTLSLYGTGAASIGKPLLVALAIIVLIFLANLVLAELVAKSFATIYVNGIVDILFPFIRVTSLLFAVPAGMVVALASLLTKRFGGQASFAPVNQAEEQIKTLAESAQKSGEIEREEQELLHSVFEFTDTVVREVMTPRVDLEALSIQAKPEEVAKMIEVTGHSRIPLFEETDDQILGVVHAKDLLMAMVGGKRVSLRRLMRPALFVPENMSVQAALRQMKLSRSQLAVVQDEFGGTSGIVTIEDIVEELVGDIVDEYDTEEPAVVKTDTGFIFDGKTHIDDVNDEIGSTFESEEFDTIGGFVFGLFGRQPKMGESIELDGFKFTVAETDARRIQQVEVEPLLDTPHQ